MSEPRKPAKPVERSGTLVEPPANAAPGRPPGAQAVERSGTLIETDDDLIPALQARAMQQPAKPSKGGDPKVPAPQSPGPRPASPFRPTVRPPLALLTVFDDGKSDGEVIRIRDHRFVIGRTEGDLRVGFDGRMSSRHVEITHQFVGGQHRWVVTDLQSTHGLYVRVSRMVLSDGAEFLVGTGRYRFDAPSQGNAEVTVDHVPGSPGFGATHGWNDGGSPFRPPAVTELLGSEIGNRILLIKEEYWIGSDRSCPICRVDDPFCEPWHVRLYRGGTRGGWHAEHPKTNNGLWMRMSQINVESTAQFQIGEQRFQLRVK
jgi:hypothetical protein